MISTDLSGQKFGKLTVLERDFETQKLKNSKDSIWKCQCECGNIISVRRPNLVKGLTKSCGCIYSDAAKSRQNKKFEEEIGKQYGELTVISDTGIRNASRQRKVKCVCSCGKEVIVDLVQLKTGHTKSCGHIKSNGELQIERFLSKNNILFKKEYSFNDLFDKRVLRFDFAIFNKNEELLALVECNGLQHYKETRFYSENMIKHDIMKRKYCDMNHILLIEIPYEGQTFTEDYLNKEIIEKVFGEEK
jgi:hypothetical protein